jgi:hypothetical protein
MKDYSCPPPNDSFARSIFTDAAVAADRSKKAEKRYEAYKKSQEARMYNHPGPDARSVLVEKLQALRAASHEESERLARIVGDLETLPSHKLSDVVAYNEHNHLTKEAEAEEKRMAAIDEVMERWNEKHEHVDRNLAAIKAQLDELAREKQARETFRDLPPPMDPNKMIVEEAETTYKVNAQRVAAVEVRIRPRLSILTAHFTEFVLLQAAVQTITTVESTPHRDGPNRTIEESLPNMDSQALQLQEFTEGIVKVIKQVPVVREEIHALKAQNEKSKEAEKAVSVTLCRRPPCVKPISTRRASARSTSTGHPLLHNWKPSMLRFRDSSRGCGIRSRRRISSPPSSPSCTTKLTS